MKIKKYHAVGTFPKSNWIIVETEAKIDTPNTHIHDLSLSCLGTGTSIKSGRVKKALLQLLLFLLVTTCVGLWFVLLTSCLVNSLDYFGGPLVCTVVNHLGYSAYLYYTFCLFSLYCNSDIWSIIKDYWV